MNQHYKKIRALLGVLANEHALDDLIMDAMKQNNTPVSKSRLQGWRVAPDHKNYRRMSESDLLAVLDALINFYNDE